jgi:hypothetical protein
VGQAPQSKNGDEAAQPVFMVKWNRRQWRLEVPCSPLSAMEWHHEKKSKVKV